jgi:thymidylate synthase
MVRLSKEEKIEHHKNACKKYYMKNQEKYKEYKKKKLNGKCELCNCIYFNLKEHMKTKKHKYIQQITLKAQLNINEMSIDKIKNLIEKLNEEINKRNNDNDDGTCGGQFVSADNICKLLFPNE